MPVLPHSPLDHNIIRVVMTHLVDGSVQRNVFHVTTDPLSPTAFFAEDVANACLDWWANGFGGSPPAREFMGEGASLSSILCKFTPAFGVVKGAFLLLNTTGLAGPVGQPTAAANCTLAVEWLTQSGGRSGHGRTYLCGMTTNLLAGAGTWRVDPFRARGVVESYRGLIGKLATWKGSEDLYRLVVFHRQGLPGRVGHRQFYTPIVDCRLSDYVADSQRGRLPGHVTH